MAKRDIELNLGAPDGPIRDIYLEFRDNEDFLEMASIGGFSTAKSNSLVDAMLLTCINYPGCETLVARAKLTDLKATTLTILEQRAGNLFSMAGGSMNRNEGIYRLPPVAHPVTEHLVQSTIRAIGLDRSDLLDVMKSRQPFRVFLEEGNEMGADVHNLSLLRARQQVWHRTLKERHRVQMLSDKWQLAFDVVQGYLGFKDEDLKRPMRGLVGVKTIFNPGGNDHLWKRYVGVPYPDGGVTPEWVAEHIGIREEHTPPEEHLARRYEFLPDDVVLWHGARRTVGCTDLYSGKVVLIPQPQLEEAKVEPKELTLITQRAALYSFPWMNKSGNKDNHKASFLIPDKDMARKFFEGKIDVKSGLVFPQFDRTRHVKKAPSLDMLKGIRFLGGIDHGGGHASAAVIAAVTKDDKLVVIKEYVQAGLSASQNAYNVKGLLPVGMGEGQWYGDPSMFRTEYATDDFISAADRYIEAGLMLEPAPMKGDEAFDLVKTLLEFKTDWLGSTKRADLYISEECEYLIEAMETLTWKDLRMRRDKWIVDVGDCLKYMCAGRNNIKGSSADVPIKEGRPVSANFARRPQAWT